MVTQFDSENGRCMNALAARKFIDVDTKDDWIEAMTIRSVSSWSCNSAEQVIVRCAAWGNKNLAHVVFGS